MISLTKLENLDLEVEDVHYTPSKKVKAAESIKQLPEEILHLILSYLNETYMYSTMLVNKRWKSATQVVLGRKMSNSIKMLTKFVLNNLNKYLKESDKKYLAKDKEDPFKKLSQLLKIKKEYNWQKDSLLRRLDDVSVEDVAKVSESLQGENTSKEITDFLAELTIPER